MELSQIKKEIMVVALGGNAIIRKKGEEDIEHQFLRTQETMEYIVEIIKLGSWHLLITHGNGPQVGDMLLRSELSSTYPIPLDSCVAYTQGSMGYMLQQTLTNTLKRQGINIPVVSIITQVQVNPHDPAFKDPSKPVGRFMKKEEALTCKINRGWDVKENAGRGWRRVVASPRPLKILELSIIKLLLNQGVIVIAGGGGGVPVRQDPDGTYQGEEAVIDKDLTSSVLAQKVGAHTFLILTGERYVALNYRTPNQIWLKKVRVKDIKKYYKEGHFPPGSMGPKIKAALEFLEAGGKRVIITSAESLLDALIGKTGTRIFPEN
jgi:carbamate kinase